jgi:hypothetical protein
MKNIGLKESGIVEDPPQEDEEKCVGAVKAKRAATIAIGGRSDP